MDFITDVIMIKIYRNFWQRKETRGLSVESRHWEPRAEKSKYPLEEAIADQI